MEPAHNDDTPNTYSSSICMCFAHAPSARRGPRRSCRGCIILSVPAFFFSAACVRHFVCVDVCVVGLCGAYVRVWWSVSHRSHLGCARAQHLGIVWWQHAFVCGGFIDLENATRSAGSA